MPNATEIIFVTPDSTRNLDEFHAFLNDYFESGYDFEAANWGTVMKARLVSLNDPSLPQRWYNSRDNWFLGGVYIGTFEGLNEKEFIEFVRTTDWEKREQVQVLLRSSQDCNDGWRFEEITLPDVPPDRCPLHCQ